MLLVSKVAKNDQNGAPSYQLRDIGKGGGAECVGVTVNLFMCDIRGAFYSVHGTVTHSNSVSTTGLI